MPVKKIKGLPRVRVGTKLLLIKGHKGWHVNRLSKKRKR